MENSINYHFEKPEENSGYLLWQVTMLWQRKMKTELDKIDLTHTQFVLLAALGWLTKTEKNVTQIEIAKHSNTDRMMVSKVLKTLQEKDFIIRKENLIDTRAKNIFLTKRGQSILRKALKLVEQVDNNFFGVLSNKQTELKLNLQTLIKKN